MERHSRLLALALLAIILFVGTEANAQDQQDMQHQLLTQASEWWNWAVAKAYDAAIYVQNTAAKVSDWAWKLYEEWT